MFSKSQCKDWQYVYRGHAAILRVDKSSECVWSHFLKWKKLFRRGQQGAISNFKIYFWKFGETLGILVASQTLRTNPDTIPIFTVSRIIQSISVMYSFFWKKNSFAKYVLISLTGQVKHGIGISLRVDTQLRILRISLQRNQKPTVSGYSCSGYTAILFTIM